MNKRIIITLALAGLTMVGVAQADPIMCGDTDRTATLDSASSCVTSQDIGSTNNNPTAEDIQTAYPSDPWLKLFDVAVSFTNGDFDSNNVDLDWTLPADIWSMWDEIVITIHVGGGQSTLSWFAWMITPGETMGTLSYDRLNGGGGGFSNIKAWGRGEGGDVSVPEPGTLAILGLGLVGMVAARRRKMI
jgi:hypothetical protein